MPEESLIPQVKESLEAIEAIKSRAAEICVGLSDKQASWNPDADKWSVSQCLEHINISDGLYFQHLERAIQKGEDRKLYAQGPFRYSRLGAWFERTLEPPVTPKKKKFTAPAMFSPVSEIKPIAPLLEQLTKNQDHLAGLLRRSSGLNLRRIKVRSPASAMLRFNLGQAFRVLGAHTRRHLWQAEQVLASPEFPRGAG